MYSEALVREVLQNKNGTLGLWWDTRGWGCQVWNVRSWAGQTALLAGAFSRARGLQIMNYEQAHDFPFYSSSFILDEVFWILISCPLILRNSKIKVSKWTEVPRKFSTCIHARESLRGALHSSQASYHIQDLWSTLFHCWEEKQPVISVQKWILVSAVLVGSACSCLCTKNLEYCTICTFGAVGVKVQDICLQRLPRVRVAMPAVLSKITAAS